MAVGLWISFNFWYIKVQHYTTLAIFTEVYHLRIFLLKHILLWELELHTGWKIARDLYKLNSIRHTLDKSWVYASSLSAGSIDLCPQYYTKRSAHGLYLIPSKTSQNQITNVVKMPPMKILYACIPKTANKHAWKLSRCANFDLLAFNAPPFNSSRTNKCECSHNRSH